jgi:tRNA(Ile)-lysidine synthetase-like protein
MDLREPFRRHLDTLALPSRRVLVAVSGGPDSVALLDLLLGCRDDCSLELAVGHVDHGIHPQSSAIARGVTELAARAGLPSYSRALGLGPGTVETAARAARYAALEELRMEAGAELIATGHHADDQAETVVMRVLGGSGPAGLAGMAPLSGRLLRPLLPFRRADLARHVLQQSLHSWDDPANADPAHLRSWVRGTLLPMLRERLESVDARLLRVAEHGRIDREGWAAALSTLPELELEREHDGVSVAAPPLGRYDSKLALCLVMALGREAGWPLGPARARRVLDLAVRGVSGRSVELGGGWTAEVVFDRLRLAGPAGEPAGAVALSGAQGAAEWGSWRFSWTLARAPEAQSRRGRTAWFRPELLAVRPWRSGEKLRPLGGRGSRLLAKCFQEARVPRSLRRGWPALEHRGIVVWVPGVCRSDLLVPVPGEEALRVDAELG